MPRRFAVLLTAAIATVGIAAGCGDDDGSGSESGGGSIATSTQPRPQFVKQASEICSRERQDVPQRIAAYQEKNPPGDKPPDVAQADGVQAVILPVLESEVDRIRDLGAPAGDEEQVEAILTGQQEANDEVAELEKIPPEEDGWERYFDSTNKLMVAYGLDACAVR